MAIFQQNFNCVEVQPLAVTGASAFATFATPEGIKADDCRIVNTGPNGAWVQPVVASTTLAKNVAGGVAGTKGTYIESGADIVIGKGTCAFIAAICDGAGTAQLYLHAGKGS